VRRQVIAYSRGVDSAFLLAVAAETIGDRCLGETSLSRQALTERFAIGAPD
jgi:PP-loop superfamily ATP-utilizing enzyme